MKLQNTEEISERSNANTKPNLTDICAASCRKLLSGIRNVRSAVVAEFRDRLRDHEHLLELAVNEAEALAWQSGFPQLLFPTLAMEKARSVALWHARQQALWPAVRPLPAWSDRGNHQTFKPNPESDSRMSRVVAGSFVYCRTGETSSRVKGKYLC